MAYVNFVKSKTRAQAIEDSKTNTGKIYFPTDTPYIIMNNKEYGKYIPSVISVTSVEAIDVSADYVIAALDTSTTLNFSANPDNGSVKYVIIKNTGTQSITISFPSSWVVFNSMTLNANSYMKLNILYANSTYFVESTIQNEPIVYYTDYVEDQQ